MQLHTLPKILLVDDEIENLRALERTLQHQFECSITTSPHQALELILKADYAVVVVDQRMPEMLGTDLLAQIALTHPLISRVILTAYPDSEAMLASINRAEIYRFIQKPWNQAELITTLVQAAERSRLLKENKALVTHLTHLNQNLEAEVKKRTAELQNANQRLSEQASTDPLTKLLNRRALFQRFHEEVERSRRYKHYLGVVMVDVDHFKEFNDMEGHLAGDEALKKIAATLTSSLRKTDFVGRYGGEEFIVLMTETPPQGAFDTMERIRSVIERTAFLGNGQNAYLTVSMGLSFYPDHGDTPETLVHAADQALYEAKESGRNRVVKR